ncbi:MAG TPA: hypothetical protein VLA36_11500 [Longimicrobiales bacterium]|nr:hypothetical protein [Longimicrobiales bacterium]
MKPMVILGGAVARRVEFGGHVWAMLQWALGMRRLGWKVLFLDRLDPEPGLRHSSRVERFVSTMRRFELEESFSLDLGPDEEPVGWSRKEVLEATARADFFFNIMGYIDDPAVLGVARRLVFVDIDPGFPQMWAALGYCDMFAGHDAFVTVGGNIGGPGCTVPTQGLAWTPVRPPVVLELWPPSEDRGSRFTSVGSWRGPYDPVVFEGETYGLRVHEFRRFASVPRDSGLAFEVALDVAEEDREDVDRLEDGGWAVVDPTSVSSDPEQYQRYIRGSRSEFLVAKNMYVRSKGGWLSDRTACYLASGRPALVQDTGLVGDMATGEGLVTFATRQEAVAGALRIEAEWARHSKAARELAAEYFDARRVLSGLVDAVAV